LKVMGDSVRRGTEIHFSADEEIFGNVIDFHYDVLSKRIRELSFLNNGVKIELIDERDGRSENFAFSGGVKGFVEYINRAKTVLHPTVFYATGESRVGDSGVMISLRSRHAVEQRLPGTGALLHQQHPAIRWRHPPDRSARGDDAGDQQVHRRTRNRQEGQGGNHRRRHARRTRLRAVGEDA
jgi:hypothetical protein